MDDTTGSQVPDRSRTGPEDKGQDRFPATGSPLKGGTRSPQGNPDRFPTQGPVPVPTAGGDSSSITTLTISAPARLLTTNAERSMHWSQHLAREAKLPRFKRAELTFDIVQRRGVLADAVTDGLVDAHILVNDDPEYVTAIVQHAPIRGTADAVVHLKGVLA